MCLQKLYSRSASKPRYTSGRSGNFPEDQWQRRVPLRVLDPKIPAAIYERYVVQLSARKLFVGDGDGADPEIDGQIDVDFNGGRVARGVNGAAPVSAGALRDKSSGCK